MKRFASLLAVITLLISGVAGPFTAPASAVTAADWKPGRIIDDGIFTDAQGMSVGEIQNFLNSKVPACDSNGTKPSEFGGGTRAQWAIARGYPGAFTCLRDYYEVPKTEPGNYIPANNYGGKPVPAGAISAAQMIYNASQRYQINPKVLLVTIQKESSGPLTTDEWPLEKQYTYAMGARCPDSGPGGSANCDANYAGFSLQISESAALMRWYLDSMSQSWWQYKKPYQNNYVLWNVSQTGCGGANVYIENKATAALYTYTPYQPNQAALNNMYGTGDGCSAYGNRNFWRIYSDWFGKTTGKSYDYAFAASSDWINTLEYGQISKVIIRVKNTGNNTWYSDDYLPKTTPVRLMISGYQSTDFADLTDSAWLSRGQIKMVERTVMPGELATFTFRVKAPLTSLVSDCPFTLVADGIGPMEHKGINFKFATAAPSYRYEGSGLKLEPRPNDIFTGTVAIKNSGTSTWYADGSVPSGQRPTRLIGQNYSYIDFADLTDSNWLTYAQIKMQTPVVSPGQNAIFSFRMKSPAAKKIGHFYTLTPVLDGVAGLVPSGATPKMTIDVPEPMVSADLSSIPPTIQLVKDVPTVVTLTLKNTGNTVWHNESMRPLFSPTRIVTYNPYYRLSPSYTPSGGWLTPAQIGMQENTVQPGESATFKFSITSSQLGTRKEQFTIIIDGARTAATSNVFTLTTITTP